MPQIQIEHDIGDTVYVITSKHPLSVTKTNVIGCLVEIATKGQSTVVYKLSGYTEEVRSDYVFKDSWSAFNPDAPTAQD